MKVEQASIQNEATAGAKFLRQKKVWAVSREQQGTVLLGDVGVESENKGKNGS